MRLMTKRYYEEYVNTNLKPPLMPVPDRCGEPALPPKGLPIRRRRKGLKPRTLIRWLLS